MKTNLQDYKVKEERILRFLSENQMDGMIIGRRDNFSWLTNGMDNGVVLSSEVGFSYLYISKDERICISLFADDARAKDELLEGLGFEHVAVYWTENSKEDYLAQLIQGKKVMSDIAIANAHVDVNAIYRLHYPLTELEIQTYRELGEMADCILTKTAKQIKQGMTELELKKIFLMNCAEYDVDIDVLLIGSDERIFQYRHCAPTNKKIDRYVMISPVFRKYGLHVNLCRLVHIGEPSEEIKRKYDAVCQIQANIIAMSQAGIKFKKIYDLQKRLYEQMGYAKEWEKHMHGAPIGYMLADGSTLFDEDRVMDINQPYEWFVTITGAKSAELVVNINNTIEILSTAGYWKCNEYIVDNKSVYLPEIRVI